MWIGILKYFELKAVWRGCQEISFSICGDVYSTNPNSTPLAGIVLISIGTSPA